MRQPPKLSEFFRFPVTAGTALLAIGVTIAWMASVDVSALFESAMIRRGELWRLVTSIFPHVSIFHLGFNVYWLWVFGTLVEEVYGHAKTAALFLLFAVGSGALEFAFSDGGVGLSGVGYGLFGLLWILSKRDPRFADAIDRRTVETFIIWFFVCIATTYLNVMRVANIAHGAGAALGILTAYAITHPQRRTAFASAVVLVLGFGIWGSTIGRPRVNASTSGGYEEARWGYDALIANRNQEAVKWLHDAVAYKPDEPTFLADLAIASERMGDREVSRAIHLRAANKGDAQSEYSLGLMYENGTGGMPKSEKDALVWYRKAADQGNVDAQNATAWILCTSEDPSNRDPKAALDYASKAVNSAKEGPDPNHLDTLAEAYYLNDRPADAVKTEQLALEALDVSEPPESRTDFVNRLDKYQRALTGDHHRAKQP